MSQFNFYISQGFFFYDTEFNSYPMCVWANNINEAILKAKQIFSLNDLNKLRSRISQLEMELFQLKVRGSSSVDENPYDILGVTKGMPKKQIKSQYFRLVKALQDSFLMEQERLF